MRIMDMKVVEYWFTRTEEDMAAAKELLTDGLYRPSISRSAYAVYHAMNAVMEYCGCDVTAFYDHTLEPHFNEKLRSILDQAVKAKRDAEYKPFYDPHRKDAIHFLDNAIYFYKQMKIYTRQLKVS